MRSLLIGLVLCSACHHPQKPPIISPAASLPVAPPTAVASPALVALAGGAGTCGKDADCAEHQLCIRHQCVAVSEGLAECRAYRIRFDFNDSQIRDSERDNLKRMARCLRADHAITVTIEGHADERGTQDYNLSLGDKRANTVAHYLELLGVSRGQLRTVSFGKEQPLCTEHDEACWSQNRRAALQPRAAR